MNRETVISEFVTFLIEEGNWETSDRIYLTNRLLFLIGEADFLEENVSEHKTDCSPVELVDELVKIGQENKRIDESEYEVEALRGQLMDLVTPSPSQVNQRFNELYEVDKEEATRYFFELSQKNDYIKTREIARNIEFPVETEFGNLDITINLSKPEKDPKQIASSLTKQQSDYPKCMLCLENEGYAGRSGYPNRFNHRVIRTQIDDNEWGFQYSPYAYYNEHSIIFSKKHEPMVINRQTFQSLLGIIDWLPHYFVGSNADIPIVGGSILSHNHYQAGRFTFPLEKSEMRETFTLPDFSSVEAGIVNWPMSVIRLRSENKEELIEVADFILSKWRSYSDEDLSIVAKTSDGVNHHTITPIARKRAGKFEFDLVLRDNNTSEEFPDGIFHPHQNLHHIKKENIGLIEVMGLAILPPRLNREMIEVKRFLLDEAHEMADYHETWATRIKETQQISRETVDAIVNKEIGLVFLQVLKDAGVYKLDEQGLEGFKRFIAYLES